MRNFCLYMLLCCSLGVFAQSKTTKQTNKEDIFESLAAHKANQGTVRITQNQNMLVLMDKKIAENEEKQHITFLGYRVQVYMGNNQKVSKTDAIEREKKIKEKYPELNSYLSFASPFWKLRVGDFRTHTEALVLSKQLQADYPEFAGDVIIVRDEETRDLSLEEAK